MILVETGTNIFKENMTVLMSDRLSLTFDVRGRVRLSSDDRVVDSMFNDIALGDTRTLTSSSIRRTSPTASRPSPRARKQRDAIYPRSTAAP